MPSEKPVISQRLRIVPYRIQHHLNDSVDIVRRLRLVRNMDTHPSCHRRTYLVGVQGDAFNLG